MMNAELHIRPEQERDISQISGVIKSAFEDHPHSSKKEHLLVSDLRNKEALVLSLVAERSEKIVGHIAFSEVMINREYCSWYGLAPVSVGPEYQNKGIGSALIKAGLKKLKQRGARGCVLLGEPDYYGRFGFKQHENFILEGVPPEYFLMLPFYDEVPGGKVEYHQSFTKYS